MARAAGTGRRTRKNTVRKSAPSAPVEERRVATPRSDLFVIKVGNRYGQLEVSSKERASGVLAKVAKVLTKPGVDRNRVFQSASYKPVFAYSIYANDPTKVVREDASGKQTIGRFVSGRFRPISSARVTY